MTTFKRWAQVYFQLSPIFKSPSFGKVDTQHLMAINPRLFAAYCAKMNKGKLYDNTKIEALLNTYYPQKKDFCLDYIRELVTIKSMRAPQQFSSLQRYQFQSLIAKLYNKTIQRKQFKSLVTLYHELLTLGEIIDLDNYLLDLSYFQVCQIYEISQMSNEQALESIGFESLLLIQKEVHNQINKSCFRIISLLNRLKGKYIQQSYLHLTYQLFQMNINFKCLMTSTIYKHQLVILASKYMLWLLQANQLGEFVYLFAKNNYLLSEYSANSIKIIWNIIQDLPLSKSIKLPEALVLNEIVYKLMKMQKQRRLLESIKQNLIAQQTLQRMRRDIQNIVQFHEKQSLKQTNANELEQIDNLQIDFQSSHSINVIRRIIEKLYQHHHFSIIFQHKVYSKILSLCLKADLLDLRHKIKLKLKNLSLQIEGDGLLHCLQKISLKQPLRSKQYKDIRNIYELKRIKNILNKSDTLEIITKQLEKQKILLLQSYLNKSEIQLKDTKVNRTIFQQLFQNFNP